MSDCKYPITVTIIDYLHMFIWLFVLFSWIRVDTAKFNLLYVIPLIYASQASPYCLPDLCKKYLCPEQREIIKEKLKNSAFTKLQVKAKEYCAFSPISYQGLIILSMILCVYNLYLNGNLT